MKVKLLLAIGLCAILVALPLAGCAAEKEAAGGVLDDETSTACTIIAVGKDATVDGSAIISHTCDSSWSDPRVWIIPAADWPEGSTREIWLDSHSYGVPIPTGEVGREILMGEMDQVPHTYQYFASRYSFVNDQGLAMGESSCSTERGSGFDPEVRTVLNALKAEGIVDAPYVMDIALERCTTAREATRLMGDLVEEYGWNLSGENIMITDGDEVWISEWYGGDLWVAVKLPDDSVFVCGNKYSLNEVALDDEENCMHSPNLVSFAVEQGWYDPASGPFRPADVYGARKTWNNREWAGYNLVAPSLGLQPNQYPYPQFVVPDKKLSVDDVYKMQANVFEGTEFDKTQGLIAGPFGDPLSYSGAPCRERAIGVPNPSYIQISQAKEWLPNPIKTVVWHGWGYAGTNYITPLWGGMKSLPDFYHEGSRRTDFSRDSGWWTQVYVQYMARLCYSYAIQDIMDAKYPRLTNLYATTASLQEAAGELYEKNPKLYDKHQEQLMRKSGIDSFAYETACEWQEDWLKLGDHLFFKYNDLSSGSPARDEVPDWWYEAMCPGD